MILIDGKRSGRVSALDRGLAYRDGVFRTMRAVSGDITSWVRHCRKLAGDCAALEIECPGEALLRAELGEVTGADPHCVLKVSVTRGLGGRGYAAPAQAATRIIASIPLPLVAAQSEQLAGDQRERVIEAAAHAGIPCAVEVISRQRVFDSHQVLLVNSVIGLWWVSALDEQRWHMSEHPAAIKHCLENLGD